MIVIILDKSSIQDVMFKIKEKEIKVVIYELYIKQKEYLNFEVVNDFDKFKILVSLDSNKSNV